MHHFAFLNHATKRPRRSLILSFGIVLLLALISACGEVEGRESASGMWTSEPSSPSSPSPIPTGTPTPAKGSATKDRTSNDTEQGRAGGSTAGTALAMLDELEVKGRSPKTGYAAELFKWRSDADHNGCDTRNDVLRRDLRDITLKSGTNGCVVIKGTLADRYKGETYAFERSPANIDIDHIVARSNAWQTGASKFDEDTLKEFGNDPLNLLAVSSSLNRQKGDGDAATWLPPSKSYRCEYVARQIAVKHKYDLWVVKPEKAAMERVLGSCEDETAFASDVSWPEPGEGDNVKTAKEQAPKDEAPKEAPPTKKSDSVYYENCTAVRDAGAAPVHRGDPGYGSHLDRDGDGVGCE